MKNAKLATKISLFIIITLFIGLTALFLITSRSFSSAMQNSTIDRMTESTETQAAVIEEFIKRAESFLHGFVFSQEVIDLLKNPEDEAAFNLGQKYLEKYASANNALENIYICDYGSTVKSSLVTAVIGKTLREGDSLRQLQSQIFSSTDVYNTGIFLSPTTGKQVISMYCPIYDEDGTAIGYAGAAVFADGLMDVLKELNNAGSGNGSTLLLDINKGVYIFHKQEDKLGIEIDEPGLVDLVNSVKNNNSKTGTHEFNALATGEPSIAVYKNIEHRGWLFLDVNEKSEVYKDVNSLRNTLLIVCIIVLIVIVATTWFIISFISKGISEIGNIISRLGQLDLTQENELRQYSDRTDEIGIIASATEKLTGTIKGTVMSLRDRSTELQATSELLFKAANNSFETVAQVDNAIQEISKGATNQADRTQEASESVLTIGNMIQDTSEKSEQLYTNSTEMQKSSKIAVDTLKNLNSVNEKAKQAIDIIYKQTNNTNESAAKIRQAASLITSIAEETTLLSLNASIEAARAGDQGRGFAVVASEIQKLAEQSNNSAQHIDEIINSLIIDSSNAVDTMNEVREIMNEQSSYVTKTEKIFSEVQNGVDESIESVNVINNRISDMDKERITVIDAVQSLAAIAEENAASTEETSASTTEVNEVMSSILESVNKLADIAKDIDKQVGVFKI